MSASLSISSEDLQTALGAQVGPHNRITLEPENVEKDLARLLLGLMEFLRQIMELRAIERMEDGRLTEEQEERLGTTLMRAEQAIQEMAQKFGLEPSDLALDLGPLGKTI